MKHLPLIDDQGNPCGKRIRTVKCEECCKSVVVVSGNSGPDQETVTWSSPKGATIVFRWGPPAIKCCSLRNGRVLRQVNHKVEITAKERCFDLLVSCFAFAAAVFGPVTAEEGLCRVYLNSCHFLSAASQGMC